MKSKFTIVLLFFFSAYIVSCASLEEKVQDKSIIPSNIEIYQKGSIRYFEGNLPNGSLIDNDIIIVGQNNIDIDAQFKENLQELIQGIISSLFGSGQKDSNTEMLFYCWKGNVYIEKNIYKISIFFYSYEKYTIDSFGFRITTYGPIITISKISFDNLMFKHSYYLINSAQKLPFTMLYYILTNNKFYLKATIGLYIETEDEKPEDKNYSLFDLINIVSQKFQIVDENNILYAETSGYNYVIYKQLHESNIPIEKIMLALCIILKNLSYAYYA